MRRLCVAALLVTAAVAGGCGDDDDDTGPAGGAPGATTAPASTAQVTKASYIQKADKYCDDSRAQFEKFEKKISDINDATEADEEFMEQSASVFRDLYDAQRAQLRGFRDIQPPEEDREIVDKYLDSLSDQQGLFNRIAAAAQAQDNDRFVTLAKELPELQTRSNSLAQGYGYKSCGRDSE